LINIKKYLYPEQRMYNSIPWQIWAIGWRFVFYSYFCGTLALILGLGVSYLFIFVFIPFLGFYHFVGSAIWNLKKWARKAVIAEHIVIGIMEILFVILLFRISPDTKGWHSFSILSLKIVIVDSIVRSITLYYLFKNKKFPAKSDKKMKFEGKEVKTK